MAQKDFDLFKVDGGFKSRMTSIFTRSTFMPYLQTT